MLARVMEHLSTFSDRDQEVIAMRYGAGFQNKEIAQILGLSENHVAVNIHRTLKKLRDALDSEYSTGTGKRDNHA